MKISLNELNNSYQALERLTAQSLPKNTTALQYKLKRTIKTAKKEIETLAETLNELMEKCGITPGQPADAAAVKEYQRISKEFLKSETVEFWADPIKRAELLDKDGNLIISISPLDEADLSWLILDDEQPDNETEGHHES
jgi:hypothetical protein